MTIKKWFFRKTHESEHKKLQPQQFKETSSVHNSLDHFNLVYDFFSESIVIVKSSRFFDGWQVFSNPVDKVIEFLN